MITLPITCKQIFFSAWLGMIIISTFIMIYDFGIGLIVLIMTVLSGIALAFCADYIPTRCRCSKE